MKAFLIEEFRAFKNMKSAEGKSKKKKGKKTSKKWEITLWEPSFVTKFFGSKPKHNWPEDLSSKKLVFDSRGAISGLMRGLLWLQLSSYL